MKNFFSFLSERVNSQWINLYKEYQSIGAWHPVDYIGDMFPSGARFIVICKDECHSFTYVGAGKHFKSAVANKYSTVINFNITTVHIIHNKERYVLTFPS